jgi:hypothetical protein
MVVWSCWKFAACVLCCDECKTEACWAFAMQHLIQAAAAREFQRQEAQQSQSPLESLQSQSCPCAAGAARRPVGEDGSPGAIVLADAPPIAAILGAVRSGGPVGQWWTPVPAQTYAASSQPSAGKSLGSDECGDIRECVLHSKSWTEVQQTL